MNSFDNKSHFGYKQISNEISEKHKYFICLCNVIILKRHMPKDKFFKFLPTLNQNKIIDKNEAVFGIKLSDF